MKVPTITSLLIACALTVAVHAAPAAQSTSEPTPTYTAAPPPPSSTFAPPPSLPRGGSSRNGTLPGGHPPFTVTDDSALLASLVDYDFKAAEESVAHYYDAVYGGRPASRSNAVSRASASSNIIPYCVGIASNPPRVQVFPGVMTCSRDGWSTLYIFTAHTKKDPHIAPYPVCLGFASNPSRSLLFPNKSTCNSGEWTQESSFFESGMKITHDASVNVLHESNVMWQAENPRRMMMYPYYDGAKQGWQWMNNFQYRSRYRLSSPYERAYLTTRQESHEDVHKKLKVSSPSNALTSRCTLNLIQLWTFDLLKSDNPRDILGSESVRYKFEANRDECSSLVSSSLLRLARVTVRDVTSVEAIIDGKVYAAISITANTSMPPTRVRTAFIESMRTGKPVMVAEQRDKRLLPDSVVAFISDTFVTIGSESVYAVTI
ncbi:hypothetical protein BGW39_008586 [Mortierella sp. 14UC]|nr:hypothetical protein BGW39_008586 [Mortierella sp. 14UC]